MHVLFFEWDPEKARANVRKHGITFEQARTVFDDKDGIIISDPEWDSMEERFLLVGLDVEGDELVVCHCMRREESVIRIISARRADEGERENYWGQFK